jgi:hypothetical protein
MNPPPGERANYSCVSRHYCHYVDNSNLWRIVAKTSALDLSDVGHPNTFFARPKKYKHFFPRKRRGALGYYMYISRNIGTPIISFSFEFVPPHP